MKELSENFTVETDMIKSSTADRLSINNTPDEHELFAFLQLVTFSLQPIRDKFGRVNVTSGFRCEALNRSINNGKGGSPTSQHRLGQAADFRTPSSDLKKVYNWCRRNLKFGQLIYEAPQDGRGPWIHISLPRIGKSNQQRMIWDGKNYSTIEGDL